MNTFDPDALECLAAIVQEGGFERAAVRLSITQSAVSQRLRSLESQAGMVLIVRSRPVKPTPAGQLLLKHTKMQRLLRADLERELRELAPNMAPGVREHERIAIAINADSIASWALPALNALACQGLPIEVIADDQDFTLQWLREGQVLGCVTALRQPLRGCRVVELGAMEYVAVVSRDFAIGQRGSSGAGGPLLGMHNFRHLPFVAFNRKDGMPELFVAQALGLKSVNLQQFFVPSCQGMVSAVLAGWGVGILPRLLVQALLEQGQLLDALPGHCVRLPLYWHCWNLPSEVLDSLSAALQAAASRALVPGGVQAPEGCPVAA